MQILLAAVSALHVLPAVFWAGSTFAMARTGGAGLERLLFPQLGAGAVTIILGLVLAGLTHGGAMGPAEQVLALGAAFGLAAFLVQASALPQVRRMRLAVADGAAAPSTGPLVARQRIAAGLLALAVVCMVGARYA